jgi:hypothetical protein
VNIPDARYTSVIAASGSSLVLRGMDSNYKTTYYTDKNNTLASINLPSSLKASILGITDNGVIYGNRYDYNFETQQGHSVNFMVNNGNYSELSLPTGYFLLQLDGDTFFAGLFDDINGSVSYFTVAVADIAAVPEPSQVAASLLLAAGIAGFVIVKRRKEASLALAA